MTQTILNLTSFTDRKAQLQRDLETAETVYAEAALANAVGTGSDSAQDKAKVAVERAKDKIAALDAAWQEAQKRHLASTRETQREVYSAFMSDLEKAIVRRREAALAAISAAEVVADAELAFEASEEEIRELAANCEAATRTKRLVEGIRMSVPSSIIAGLAPAIAERRRKPEPRSHVETPSEVALRKLDRSDENLRGQAAMHAPKPLTENA